MHWLEPFQDSSEMVRKAYLQKGLKKKNPWANEDLFISETVLSVHNPRFSF